MSHTPGPWQVIPGDNIRRPRLVRDFEGFVIAEAHWNEHMDGEAEDNATLIAAAPDMLAALKAVEASCPTDSDVTAAFEAAWVLLLDAIEKAEGR